MSGVETTPARTWAGEPPGSMILMPAEEDRPAGSLPESQPHWEVPFLATVCIFGVLGNLTVLSVYSKAAFRRSNAALYILNLAAGDLFLLLVVVPLHITEYYPSTWPYLWRYDAQCILHRYGRFAGFNLNVFTMVAIAVDRYLAVCHSLVYRAHCTLARTRLCILAVWTLAGVTAAPSSINFAVKYQVGEYIVNYAGKTPLACQTIFLGSFFLNFKVIYVSMVLFWVPVLATAITYTVVVVYVWRNNRKFSRCTSAGRHLRSHWKAARTLLLVFCVYVLTYVFLATYTVVRQYATVDVSPLVKNVGLLLPYANSCLNPVVYSLVNQNFRRACLQMLCPRRQREGSGTSGPSANARAGVSGRGQQRTVSVTLSGSREEMQARADCLGQGGDEGYARSFDNPTFDGEKLTHQHGFDTVM
ncbi:allatostatin-A receptor-like [Acanthaster planci]|uniref:Allatostatin-A receptor-like n=1 Tax=Acanthaster planci TaxID=133434 RepID=A0A8B7ZLN1_ACAPL|nr:allatostatin-A receptor-like [Acanthaster planci]